MNIRRSAPLRIWRRSKECLLFNATLVLSFTPSFGDNSTAQPILMTRAVVDTPIPLPGGLLFLQNEVKTISDTCNMAYQIRQGALLGQKLISAVL